MSAAGRPDASAPAESLAAACRDAGFVRLTATADGDALAALGLLGAALRATGTPFHASPARPLAAPADTDADLTVALGLNGADVSVTDGALSVTAYDAARELGADPEPLLAVAGAVAGGFTPGGDVPLYNTAESRLERRPGVATPLADPVAGLAHSTLVHAEFSGDDDGDTLAAYSLTDPPEDDAARRRLASFVALRATDEATERAAEQVARVLHPYVGGPFRTLGGYADVLDACAETAPGIGLALALNAARGGDPSYQSEALTAWRTRGSAAHATLRRAETARHAGLFVVRTAGDVPLAAIARLAWAYRSPEPLVLATGEDTAALHGDRAAALAAEVADATTAEAVGRHQRGSVVGIDAESVESEVRLAL